MEFRFRARHMSVMYEKRSIRIAAAMILLVGISGVALGQAPGGVRLAPGHSQPDYNPGGVGPGGIPLAPGRSGAEISGERIGPGGGVIAPGRIGREGAEFIGTPRFKTKKYRSRQQQQRNRRLRHLKQR
jgi:hypothetical protein